MPSNLKKAIDSREFLITCELAPPKGPNFQDLIFNARALQGLVHAINITDGQGGNMRMSSVVASYLIQRDAQVEAICQLVCRDRNSIGLQSDILGASALGIKNFLALSGDKAAGGDNPLAKDVFDLNTDDLVKTFSNFTKGLDLADNKLTCMPVEDSDALDFCVAVAAHPGVEDLKAQATKMKLRAEAGVQFFQTQIVYEIDQLKRFMDSIVDIKQPVLIGVTPLKGAKMARFMNEKVYGVSVPPAIIERLEKTEHPHQEGIQISLELIEQVKQLGGSGIHVMAVGQEKQLPEIIKKAKEVLKA